MKALLLILIAFDFQTTTGNVTMVQICPETKTAWDKRSTIFTCEEGNMKYHCAMTTTGNLVEVCITPMNITENEKGCPMVYIQKSVASWVSSLTPCPVQNKECPQVGHGGYSTEQLYKYPSCFRNITERISGDNNITQTTTRSRVTTSNVPQEEAWKSYLEYLLVLLIAMFLMLASLHVVIYLMYLKIRMHFKEAEVMKKEWSGPPSHISSLSSKSSFDLKGSDFFPLTLSTHRRRMHVNRTLSEKKDRKRKDDPLQSVFDSRNGSSSKPYYESPVEKDMKGNDDTPPSVTDTRTRTGGHLGSQSLKQEQNTQF